MTNNTAIAIKVTLDEKAKIKELAEKNNMSVNSYIKTRILIDQAHQGEFSSLNEYEKKVYKFIYRSCGLVDLLAKELVKDKYNDRVNSIQKTLFEEGFIENIEDDTRKVR